MNNIFDREDAIGSWRQQMVAVGIKKHAVLDELENHLREEVERRILRGAAEQDAFHKAIQQIGELDRLQAEFKKANINERNYMKRGLIIGTGILGVMVGMGFVTPAVAQYRQIGAMRNGEPWLFLLGSLLTLAGCAMAIRGLKKSRA